jgi:hypothetical protein
MFIHGAEFFLFKPGFVMLTLGLLLTLPLSLGPITLGPVTFSLYFMMVGLTLAVVGLQSIYFGCLAHVFLDYTGQRREQWQRLFRYTPSVLSSGVLFVVGFAIDAAFVGYYVSSGLRVPDAQAMVSHLAIIGLLSMVVGFSTFCFTLLLHATQVRYGAGDDRG